MTLISILGYLLRSVLTLTADIAIEIRVQLEAPREANWKVPLIFGIEFGWAGVKLMLGLERPFIGFDLRHGQVWLGPFYRSEWT